MRKAILTSFALAVLISTSSAAQQTGSVAGLVTGTEAQPLSGVTVRVVGTSQATTTNAQGSYQITGIPAGEVTVQASALGYQAQERVVTVRVGQSTNLNFTLPAAALALDELVVVGYGEQRRETLTGSISTVSGEMVAASPAPNVVTSMAGRLPGLVVNQRTGIPGAENLSILIRGQATMGNNSPLIVVDGVERDNLQRLNSDDIESITVLKDASAAIYGARAANGVILVTTKRGREGAPTFSVSIESAFATPTRLPRLLDAGTFAEVFNEAQWYSAGMPDLDTWEPYFSDVAIQKYRDGSDPVRYPNTNWVEVAAKDYSLQRTANIQASGGTEAVQYRLSAGYMDQGTDFRNNPNHYTRYSARARIDAEMTDNLSLGLNVSAQPNTRIGFTGDFFALMLANPTLAAQYPNGLLAGGRFGASPLLADRRGENKIEDLPITSTFTAAYVAPFLDGLRFDASFNYDVRNQFQKNFQTPWYYHEFNTETEEYDQVWATEGSASTVSLTDTYNRWTTLLSNFRATYSTTFANTHALTMMAGAEQQKNTNNFASATRRNFVSSAIPQLNVGSNAAVDLGNSGSASESAYDNYFGRINYDIASKYLFEFLFRYDGSPTFPEENRYGFFPGASVGWRISEEPFFQDRFSFVNDLKLRGSIGKLGNDRVGNYQYLQAFTFSGNYVFGGTDVPGIRSSTLPNENITWEQSVKTDVGLETTLWNGLLGVDLTLWREKRSDILAAPQLAVSRVFGFPALPSQNIGEVNSNGYELVLSQRNTIGRDLSYNISANVAYSRSKIVYMDEVPPAEPYQAQTGHPIGSGLYFQTDGIFRTQEELNSYPRGSGARVGDPRIVDVNGDGVINNSDRIRVDQNNVPEYVFGLTTLFQYRGFDLNLFFQGQAGAKIYDERMATAGADDFANTTYQRIADRWTVNNINGSMPRAGHWQPGNTTMFLFDATFIRLKTVEAGYNLPSVLGLSNARIYLSGFNALTWARELKWADPELSGALATYPPQRILNVGLNMTL